MTLGICAPEYREMSKSNAVYSYAAFFTQDPHISRGQPVGRVDDIFGRKNAKEECAKLVLRHLKDYLAKTKLDAP
jgi:hypothetical protein